MELLTAFVVTFIEAISLTEKKELFLQLLTDKGVLKVRFWGIVHLNLSNDILDMDDDEVTVVDVYHEYRELEKRDLEHYLFEMNEASVKNSNFHIVQIHGNTVLNIICKDIVIENV